MSLDSFPDFSTLAWHRVVTELTATGFAVVEDALPAGCWQELRSEAEDLFGARAFVEGRIGPGGDTRQDVVIRSDSRCWLDRDMPAGGRYLQWMDELRVALNRRLYLGLTAFEAHYAYFPIGTFYGSHYDRYRDSNARVLSAVFYCNQDWPVGAGGEFVMYDDRDATCLTLVPRGGTLLLFLSAGARHEAKVASRARWSIAGWFRAEG